MLLQVQRTSIGVESMGKVSRVQRKRRRKKVFLSIVFTFVVGFLIFMLMLNTKFFSINNINVIGNEKVLLNKIILLSSIQNGENIFKISTKDAEKNISTLPYIKSVEVNRKIPKEIIIKIEERKERIQIKDISSFLILDEEGYILDNVGKENKNLTEIIGLNVKNKTSGENAFINNEEKPKIELIMKSVGLDMLSKFKCIDMEDNTNIKILTFDDIEVVFGSINNVEYKLNMLSKVLRDIDEKKLNAKMILMNKGENPVVVLEDKEEG